MSPSNRFAFLLQLPPLQRPLDREVQPIEIEGFAEEVVGALLHALHGRIQGAVTREHDDGNLGVEGVDPRKKLIPPHDGHLEIQQDEIHGRLGKRLQGRLAVLGRDHIETPPLQQTARGFPEGLLIVYDQDSREICH